MLPLDRDSLVAAISAGAEFKFRFFWGHRAKGSGELGNACLSQWWPCIFEVGGETYRSAEHFMMAEKARLFGDEGTRAAILHAETPADAKELGRRVSGFDETTWARERFEIVTQASLAKFASDPALRSFLLSTGDEVLVEASPTDRIWGIGLSVDAPEAREPSRWRGLNLLGFALMRARESLRR